MTFRDFVKKTLPIIVLAVIMGGAAYWLYEGANKLNVVLTVILIAIATGELVQKHWPKRSKIKIARDGSQEDSLVSRQGRTDYWIRVKAVNKGKWEGRITHDVKLDIRFYNRKYLDRFIPFFQERKEPDDLTVDKSASNLVGMSGNGRSVEKGSPDHSRFRFRINDVDEFKQELEDYEFGLFRFKVKVSDNKGEYWVGTKKVEKLDDFRNNQIS
jgi:hypothetical protein